MIPPALPHRVHNRERKPCLDHRLAGVVGRLALAVVTVNVHLQPDGPPADAGPGKPTSRPAPTHQSAARG
jgi:hypothetical protein